MIEQILSRRFIHWGYTGPEHGIESEATSSYRSGILLKGQVTEKCFQEEAPSRFRQIARHLW